MRVWNIQELLKFFCSDLIILRLFSEKFHEVFLYWNINLNYLTCNKNLLKIFLNLLLR